MKPDIVNKILESLEKVIPLNSLGQDMKENIKISLSKVFQEMDLVTREEFETQKKVLLKTREKIQKLEEKLQDYNNIKNSDDQ